MEIKQGNNKFYVGENENNPKAEITFVPHDDSSMTIDHTFVSDDFQGQGLGQQLVKKAADYARSNHKTIIPKCTFAKKILESNSNYQDIL